MFWMVAAALTAPEHARAQVPCRYEVAQILSVDQCGILDTITVGTAINPSGTTVVGYWNCPAGGPRPWMWSEKTGLVLINLPPWLVEASPADVNDHNIMVGTGVGPVAGQRGWVCDLNTMTWTELLPQNPPTGWSGASAINNSNTVVGFRSIDDGGDPVNPQTAFRWTLKDPGSFVDLGLLNGFSTNTTDINQTAVSVGTMAVNSVLVPFTWDGTRVESLGTLAGLRTIPWAINDLNIVVGQSLVPDSNAPNGNANHGFLWSQGTTTELFPLPEDLTCIALDVDASQLVVGLSRPQVGHDRGCLWWNGTAIEVSTLLPPDVGLVVRSLNAITPSGITVGIARTISGLDVAVVLQPITTIADIDGNCAVDVDDLIAVILEWGRTNSPADVTKDGVVDVDDLILVILNWSN